MEPIVHFNADVAAIKTDLAAIKTDLAIIKTDLTGLDRKLTIHAENTERGLAQIQQTLVRHDDRFDALEFKLDGIGSDLRRLDKSLTSGFRRIDDALGALPGTIERLVRSPKA